MTSDEHSFVSNQENHIGDQHTDQSPLSAQEGLEILRRFEPTICYSKGERFFPIDVTRYVSQCSLWVKRPEEPAQMLVSEGDLDIETLAKTNQAHPGEVLYLKFIEPLDLIELARYSIHKAVKSLTSESKEDRFRAGKGRLARVGYSSRFVDALFSLSLVWRGRVPGDTATAAALAYRRLQEKAEKYTYYGRILRQNSWVVIQYWFFYPFNNWRSGFFGVNDHEGDWEMICVYCSESEPSKDPSIGDPDRLANRLTPDWAAYASHDFSGDDLRRRWDDPELKKNGDHPLIYAGAGSHASYFSNGEFMAEIELPFLAPLVKFVDSVQKTWRNFFHQVGSHSDRPGFNVFRIPFVDYARGDGVRIGVNEQRSWDAQILEQNTTWATGYQGLWGLYAQDPIAGENAPAGPVYERDGRFRRSWYDPLGWAGLDKCPPSNRRLHYIDQQRKQLSEQVASMETELDTKSTELNRLGIEASAMVENHYQKGIYDPLHQKILVLSNEVAHLRNQLEINRARITLLDEHQQDVLNGKKGPLRAHLHHTLKPLSQSELKVGVLPEIFAALSVGLMMVAVVGLILFARQYLLIGLAALIGVIVFLEASFRNQLPQLINSLSIGLALVSALVILFEFFWQIVVMGVLIGGLFIIWENARELRG